MIMASLLLRWVTPGRDSQLHSIIQHDCDDDDDDDDDDDNDDDDDDDDDEKTLQWEAAEEEN